MDDRTFEPLTRKDKAVYWVMRFMPSGVFAYDWEADWRDYLRTRTYFR